MNEHNFEEQKVIIPSSQGLDEIDRVDKTKVFWTVVLAIFIVSFVFILGYWIGQQRATADYFKIMPNNSVDVSPLIGMSSDNNNSNINSENENMYIGDGLEALDNAASNQVSNTPAPNTPTNIDTVPIELAPNNSVNNTEPISIKSREVNPRPQKEAVTKPISPVAPKSSVKSNQVAKGKDVIPHLKNTNGKWAVRLVTVKSEKNAINLKKQLAKMGYSNVNMLKIGVLYRVSVLGFESQKDALSFQKQAKDKLKLSDTLVIKL